MELGQVGRAIEAHRPVTAAKKMRQKAWACKARCVPSRLYLHKGLSRG